MGNSFFQFKQFCIHQDKCAMKLGTDSIILGAWATQPAPKNILDIGTGTGILAIMMGQRYQDALIDAVEIEEKAVAQASENISQCPWGNRIKVHHMPFQEFTTKRKYDLIISNPPYFNNHHFAGHKERSLARHTSPMFFEELFSAVSKCLDSEGSFHIIIPSQEEAHILSLAKENNLYVTRKTALAHQKGKRSKRRLLSFEKKEAPTIMSELYIKDHQLRYSDEFQSLCSEFYLDF